MTATPLDHPPTFEEIRNNLGLISDYLLEGTPIAAPSKAEELIELERLNQVLKTSNQALLQSARLLYQPVEDSHLDNEQGQTLLSELNAELVTKLNELDLRHQIENKSRKSYLTFEAGVTALEQEARLRIKDRLLHPEWIKTLEKISLGPEARPGLYALTFTYQDLPVEVAGAFVLTAQATPVIEDLSGDVKVGPILLFLPSRGLEAFDSLSELDTWLQQSLHSTARRQAFIDCLPQRYHGLSAAGIWPLALEKINGEPLFEHLYNARINKRSLDIERALSLIDNPEHSGKRLYQQLDQAIAAALPTYHQRLALHAQALLERSLRHSAPGWYRSANATQQTRLAEHIQQYNQARQALNEFFGPAASPQALARYQLIEQLDLDLDIQDFNPDQLWVTTQRHVQGVGDYEHKKSLTELALRGLHSTDEQPGSDFLQRTTLSYADKPMPEHYAELTPSYLVQLLKTVQPRLAFPQVQQGIHSKPGLKGAIRHMLDRRINCLAYAALLQNHITEADYQLIQQLREGSDPRLSASTLSLHDAQLQDLWVLRQVDANGRPMRLLLCTPSAPRAEQFMAFDSEIACQTHVLGWSRDNGAPPGRHTMTDYLLERVALRFRLAMAKTLMGLSFKPHEQEYKEVKFDSPCSHADCLASMAEHFLATQVDDQRSSTPSWFTSTSAAHRRKLLTLADDAEGALRTYNAAPQSEHAFATFESYLHQHAKTALNGLLGRQQHDVDPNEVWAYYPRHVGTATPPPVNYTTLYRDGYDDSIGFLNEAFSQSATFKGPEGVDLSPLTAQKVAASVRGTWIGQRYINEVRSKLQNANSPGYAKRRDATLAITQLQMRNAALECQLKGHISSIDLAWLDASIQSMGDTSAAVRARYPIHRLRIDGDWIIDTFLFSHGDDPVLLYTPNAPDHIAFREARLFNHTLKKIDGMVGYLTERAPIQSRTRIGQFLKTAREQLPEHINRTTPSPPRYDSLARVTPLKDLRHELYNLKLQRKIDDVLATTPQRTQMITNIVWSCVEWVAAIATAPFPILSLGTGLLLAFKDAMLALEAYHQGHNDAALQHLLGYLFNAGGALFTDLRPALGSIRMSGIRVRPSLHGTPDAQAIAHTRTLQTPQPSPENMQPVLFRSEWYWAPTAPDPLGRYLLFRPDAASGQLRSTARLVEKTTDGRWQRSGVAGGAPKYEKLPDGANALKAYEIDAQHWRDVERLLAPDFRRSLITDDPVFPPMYFIDKHREHMAPIHQAYLKQVDTLSRDAEAFFSVPTPAAPRPSRPPLASDAAHPQILESLFKHSDGLVIGEVSESIASKQFLIDNMAQLARQGVKRLYIEHLPNDVFRLKLQKLNTKGSSRHIEKHLGRVDRTFGLGDGASPSYLNLMKAARRHGIELKALDAATSYDMNHAFHIIENAKWPPRANGLRNFYSHKAINADLAEQPRTRWVALAEHSRVRISEQIPGLADLHTAIGLRIDDVNTDSAVGLWSDPVDFRLTLKTSYQPPAPAAALPPPLVPSTAALPEPTHFNTFDVAPAFREPLRELQMTHRGLDSTYAPALPELQEPFSAFTQTRRRLYSAAEEYFSSYVPPAKATLPDTALLRTERDFIQAAYTYAPGLVIGEAHASESAKKFLIEHMADLKKQGIQTLYVEHLQTDLHQLELNLFNQTATMPDSLKAFLQRQDFGHMRFYDGKTVHYQGPYTYTNILQAANKHGIRVQAIDCAASYNLKGLRGSSQSLLDPDVLRNSMFSYFASHAIQADQAAHGAHKWVAFMGSAHTDTYLGIPGLAPMQGVLSLHIRDTATRLAKGFEPGAWQVFSETKWRALRSDFVLNVGFERIKTPEPFVPVDRSRLKDIGHFLIERPTPEQTNLLHKSNSGQIVSTPLQIDDTGYFFIDRWEALKDQRFLTQDSLIQALRNVIQLTPAP